MGALTDMGSWNDTTTDEGGHRPKRDHEITPQPTKGAPTDKGSWNDTTTDEGELRPTRDRGMTPQPTKWGTDRQGIME